MSHHHLTRDERVALAALLRAGHSQAECARSLGVNRSTISRELKRSPIEYKAVAADKHAASKRKNSKHKNRKIENEENLQSRIIKLLKKGRSPEQISQEVELVSDETIYTWINRSRKDLAVLLPQRGKVRRRYGKDKSQVQGWTKLVKSIEKGHKLLRRDYALVIGRVTPLSVVIVRDCLSMLIEKADSSLQN